MEKNSDYIILLLKQVVKNRLFISSGLVITFSILGIILYYCGTLWFGWRIKHNFFISFLITFLVFGFFSRYYGGVALQALSQLWNNNGCWGKRFCLEVILVVFPLFFIYFVSTVVFIGFFHTSKIVDTLSRRSWEIASYGHERLKKETQAILNQVDAFRNGVEVTFGDLQEICNSFYCCTKSREITATCLEDVRSIYNDNSKKNYIESTLNTLRNKEIKFRRYILLRENLANLDDAFRWFINAHKEARAELIGINLEEFVALAKHNSIGNDKLDFVFFKDSVVFSVRTQLDSNGQIVYSPQPNGKYYLTLLDEDEVQIFAKLHEKLKNNHHTVNLLKFLDDTKN